MFNINNMQACICIIAYTVCLQAAWGFCSFHCFMEDSLRLTDRLQKLDVT